MRWTLGVFFLYAFAAARCQSPAKDPYTTKKDPGYTFSRASADGIGKFYMGREIAQVMGASGIDWLERPQRQSEENTDLAIKKMNLGPASVVADIGAGSGYYSFRIASQLPQGKVYAVEVQSEMINYLRQRKEQTHTQNIIVVKADSMNVNLPAHSIDLAIMVDVYHELAWPREIINSLSNSLKPSGKILLIEYRGEDPAVPIKALHKTTVSELSREFNANGFKLDYRGEFLPIQHFLLFKRK
jgi:precorrin-6B methylase 2